MSVDVEIDMDLGVDVIFDITGNPKDLIPSGGQFIKVEIFMRMSRKQPL